MTNGSRPVWTALGIFKVVIGLLIGFTALFAAGSGFNVFGEDTSGAWVLWMIVFLIVGIVGALMIVYAILYARRSRDHETSDYTPPLSSASRTKDHSKEALKALGDRYIRGEITQDEYERKKKEIG